MREIKFRGKRTDNGEWVYGYYFIDLRDIEDGLTWREIPQIQQRYGDHFNYFDVDPSTVGQFTGLKDKNGVEIWEHDIFTYPNPVCRGVVRFGEYEFGEYDTYIKGCGFYLESIESPGILEDYGWVISNIHDNPSLLES